MPINNPSSVQRAESQTPTFEQKEPETVWILLHPGNPYPQIMIRTHEYGETQASIERVSPYQTKVSFSIPVTGFVDFR